MYKHILIATDGSDLARKAVFEGLNIAKALGSQVTIVTVTEPWATQMVGEAAIAFPYETYNKTMAANAAEILAGASDAARSANVRWSTVHVRERHAAEGILEAAKANGCDLIVMASHGRRGLAKLMIGSQAQKVVTHSTIPVLICR
jgi:nucleotide-binding universal stress UspA family protein